METGETETDELKALWREMERRLDGMQSALRVTRRLAKRDAFDRVRSKLRFVHLVLWFEVGVGVLVALLAGSYLADHIGTPRFALPAAALHLGAVLTIAAAARQLVALHRVDHAGPVVENQRRLAKLRVVRARANRWLLVSAPLLWAVLVVVVPHGLIGLDVYREFGVAWVAGNLGFGVAVVAAAAWVAWRFPAWTRRSAFLRWLGDDVTGRRVATASGLLDDVEAFETEEGGERVGRAGR